VISESCRSLNKNECDRENGVWNIFVLPVSLEVRLPSFYALKLGKLLKTTLKNFDTYKKLSERTRFFPALISTATSCSVQWI